MHATNILPLAFAITFAATGCEPDCPAGYRTDPATETCVEQVEYQADLQGDRSSDGAGDGGSSGRDTGDAGEPPADTVEPAVTTREVIGECAPLYGTEDAEVIIAALGLDSHHPNTEQWFAEEDGGHGIVLHDLPDGTIYQVTQPEPYYGRIPGPFEPTASMSYVRGDRRSDTVEIRSDSMPEGTFALWVRCQRVDAGAERAVQLIMPNR